MSAWLADAGRVMGRAALLGAGLGTVVGGVALSFEFPLVGTFFGAFIGLAVGALCGAVNGVVGLLVRIVTKSRWVVGLACASVSGSGCAGLVLPSDGRAGGVALSCICLAGGALLGPVAVFGAVPADEETLLSPARIMARAVLLGAGVGGLGGVIAGLVIGVVGDGGLPLMVFAAMVEGGILAAVSGVVVALVLGTPFAVLRMCGEL